MQTFRLEVMKVEFHFDIYGLVGPNKNMEL